jgi:hypothetical protein
MKKKYIGKIVKKGTDDNMGSIIPPFKIISVNKLITSILKY